MKNIFKYIKRTKNLFLVIGESPKLQDEGYTNSNFMINLDDRRSTLESMFLCNDGSTSWKSFKQPIIADSTMEAEYIATSKAAKEAF